MASATLDDPPAEAPGLVSVIVTVLDEARHISDLLDSLLVQEEPWEVLVVDAGSTDGTRAIVEEYADHNKGVRLLTHVGTRAESRNVGVREARGDAVAFIDGDCIANPFWIARLRRGLAEADVVSGRTLEIGYWAFESLHRVELVIEGVDVTYPSCNLAYDVEAFQEVGGFDDWFHTAEDIDLNYRAVQAGLEFAQAEEAVVYHRARDSISGFLEQAYWNGYGRKQLTLKHGSLWTDYSFGRMIRTQASFWGLVRLAAASVGYLMCKLKEDGYPG